ncbi:MAG: PEP/pyruvate-binding domain-containing protein [Thermoplasmatota archaeon]
MTDDENNREKEDLKERKKELECLYNISDILAPSNAPIDSIFQDIVDTIPKGFRYPDIVCSRITYGNRSFRTEKFISSPWCLSTDIVVDGKRMGNIEVYYIRERKTMDEGPFLKEERKMLNTISQRLGRFLEKTQADRQLRRYRDMLKEISSRKDEEKGEAKGLEDEWVLTLNVLLKTEPSTLFMITRKMIYFLSHYKDISFDNIMNGLCPVDSKDSAWCGINIPNPRSDINALKRVQKAVFEIAKEILEPREILDLIELWLKQSKTRPLLFASEQPNISRSEITNILHQYLSVPPQERFLSLEDGMTIRTNLIRRFLTSKLEYINIAKNYFRVEDFALMMDNIIGPSKGVGTLGGKASGIALAEKIIRHESEKNDELKDVSFARSWYISSDTMREFINYNDLEEVAHIKYLEPAEIRNEQPFLEQMFKNGVFPLEISNGLKEILREAGDVPLIVRSSSHLEDSFGAAFSGKYKSLFITNLGTPEERLGKLEDAVAEVWASTFNPNAIQYRRERGMLDLLEYMGVIIQEVVGTRVGPYFIPAYAGVALTNNEFRWSPRIRREDGILRMVVGLGTRAVDRVADDYPTLISPRRPQLRVNSLVDESVQYSQRYMDVINLQDNRLETILVEDMIREYGREYPMLRTIFSIYREGSLITPATSLVDTSNEDMVVTFNGFDGEHPHLKSLVKVMDLLNKKLGFPVDVEFASDGRNVYILQCRPQTEAHKLDAAPLPKDISDEMILFSANRYVTSSVIKNQEYVVYVNPKGYEELDSREKILNVARIIGDLNEKLPKRKFILMGPGRWGSRGDIKLGVPIQYQDINNTSLLIEIARRKGGYLPELSFGTHFFQDLVEAGIMYLPLYPDEEDVKMNRDLLMASDNHLDSFVPSSKEMAEVVRLIKISEPSRGGTLTVHMDGERNEAIAYMEPPDHSRWRREKLEHIIASLDPERLGVKAMYLTGSTKDGTAGPASDIDLIVHFKGSQEQREDLQVWFDEWSHKLDMENQERTGHSTGGLLDVHIITDQDIMERSTWASHLDSLYGSAEKLELIGSLRKR